MKLTDAVALRNVSIQAGGPGSGRHPSNDTHVDLTDAFGFKHVGHAGGENKYVHEPSGHTVFHNPTTDKWRSVNPDGSSAGSGKGNESFNDHIGYIGRDIGLG